MDTRPRSSPLSSRSGLAASQFRHLLSDHGMSIVCNHRHTNMFRVTQDQTALSVQTSKSLQSGDLMSTCFLAAQMSSSICQLSTESHPASSGPRLSLHLQSGKPCVRFSCRDLVLDNPRLDRSSQNDQSYPATTVKTKV